MGWIRWTDRARRDLKAIGSYISKDNPRASRRWVAKLRRRALAAAEMPRTGRIVPEVGREELREVLLGSYRIIYRIATDGIIVLMVFEGHRLLGALAPDE